jgi:hypothetical protein
MCEGKGRKHGHLPFGRCPHLHQDAPPRVNNAWNIPHSVNRFAFTADFGDLPVCRYNDITGKLEEVINPRVRAYAARNRARYYRRDETKK